MSAPKEKKHLFFKFGKKEHLQSLVQEGCIFCNTIQFFQKTEQNSQRYDPDEALDYYFPGNQIKSLSFQGEKFEPTGVKSIAIRLNEKQYTHIFSLTAICLNTVKESDFDFNERFWKDFGDHIAVVVNSEKFIQHLLQKLKSENLPYKAGLVEYVNANEEAGEMGVFKKFSNFAWQKEFRIAICAPNLSKKNKPLILHLGDLSSVIKGPFPKIEELFKIKIVPKKGAH